MKRTMMTVAILGGFLFSAPLQALTEAKWQDAAVKLGAPKTTLTELLGKPDSVDTGTEIYGVSDSKDVMMVMTEYQNDMVCVLAEIYRPAVSVPSLVEKLKGEKLELISEEADGIVFFAGTPETGHYVVVSPGQSDQVGPTLAKMTPTAFESFESDKAVTAQPSEAPAPAVASEAVPASGASVTVPVSGK
jgi:hypothetical protein